VYSSVPREQIADTLIHLRGLFREIPPSNEKDYRARERREILTKNMLSNLFRTKDHPTLNAVLEVADAFSLTLDGAHRLFGYELERIREYDLKLNAGRTQVREIRNLRLRASLVTLSACNTGVGPIGEEGVANIVNAFIEAGSQSVVSTL
jgi:hypothetical protein